MKPLTAIDADNTVNNCVYCFCVTARVRSAVLYIKMLIAPCTAVCSERMGNSDNF